MCNSMSGYLTKYRVRWSKKHDAHEPMIRENGEQHLDLPGNVQLARFEIEPPNGDYSKPLKTWVYRVDQDILPDWYVEEVDRERALKALPKWAKHHIIRRGEHTVAEGETRIFLGRSVCINQHGGYARFYNDATQVDQHSGYARFYNDATQVDQHGGMAVFNGHATQVDQHGGDARFASGTTQRDQHGGVAVFAVGATQLNRNL